MILVVLNIILLVLLLGVIYVLLRKISRIDRATWDLPKVLDSKINDAELRLYRQIEALSGLNALTHPLLPLPPLREWSGSPDFLLELARRVVTKRPLTVVDCGCGASTLVLARSCQLLGKGHVYALEHEPGFAQTTRDRLKEAGLEEYANVVDAPLESVELSNESFLWYSLASLPDLEIDLLVIDGPPGTLRPLARYPAGPKLIPRLTSGASVFVDDANRADETEMVRRWMMEFPDLRQESHQAEKGLVVLSKADKG